MQSNVLATIDCETDPFEAGRVPKPFACGFLARPGLEFGKTSASRHQRRQRDAIEKSRVKRLDRPKPEDPIFEPHRLDPADIYIETWGPDCIAEMMQQIKELPFACTIFAHNGGKFDFHFMLDYIDNPLSIINGRIVQARLFQHTIQDSFALMPTSLHQLGGKMDVDPDFYRLFEAGQRQRHKAEILRYMQQDCFALHEKLERFWREFGRQLTVGSTAMKQLRKIYSFPRMTQSADQYFRPYYFGGRVECIRPGIHRAKPGDAWNVYDVNSMYPYVMREFKHPIGGDFRNHPTLDTVRPGAIWFADLDATSAGALPVRDDDQGGIAFPKGRHWFKACSHEVHAALDLDMLQIHAVKNIQVAEQSTTFKEFVDEFFAKRRAAKAAGDAVGEQFYKFILNSAYGKFGTNPENFHDWWLSKDHGDMSPQGDGFEIYSTGPAFDLWRKPSQVMDHGFFDVSTAASITSAARAVLLRGLAGADTPLYCDTDSIICRRLDGVEIDAGRLGAWKLEASADMAAIAGKKLYGLRQGKSWVKVRSKGGTLSGPEIVAVCHGKIVNFVNQVPLFSPKMEYRFTNRKFRKTA